MLDEFAGLAADRRDSDEEARGITTWTRFDRLRVLSTELKRLVVAGAPVSLRFGLAPPLAGARLASVFWWV